MIFINHNFCIVSNFTFYSNHFEFIYMFCLYFSDDNKSNAKEENSSSEPECLTCSLTYLVNETETEISLFLRKHSSVTGNFIHSMCIIFCMELCFEIKIPKYDFFTRTCKRAYCYIRMYIKSVYSNLFIHICEKTPTQSVFLNIHNN